MKPPSLLHQYTAIMGYREIAHATRQSILLSLATSQMQSETRQRKPYRLALCGFVETGMNMRTLPKHHEGPAVLYCIWLTGKEIIAMANSSNSVGRNLMFLNIALGASVFMVLQKKKILHQSVMKSRLDQRLGERWNGAELNIWKQQRIVPSRCTYNHWRAGPVCLVSLWERNCDQCLLFKCLFCHKRTAV